MDVPSLGSATAAPVSPLTLSCDVLQQLLLVFQLYIRSYPKEYCFFAGISPEGGFHLAVMSDPFFGPGPEAGMEWRRE